MEDKTLLTAPEAEVSAEEIQALVDEVRIDQNRAQRRAKRRGFSKHARFMILNGKVIKISLTKRRPWVVKDERRRENKRAKIARRKNR